MPGNESRRQRGEKRGERDAPPAPAVAVVGRTQWDFVSGALAALRRPTVSIPVSLVTTGVVLLVILGYVRLSYDKDGLTYGIGKPGAESATGSTGDLVAKGRELKRPYILDSVAISVRVRDVDTGAGRERHVVWRIHYAVRALRRITKSDKVFKENYHTEGADTTRWFGSEEEMRSTDGGYYVLFNLEEGQTRVVTTGATNVFRLPLESERPAFGESLRLSAKQQFVSYENSEDVIGDLTMLVESENPNFAPVGEAAKRSPSSAGAAAASDEGHLFRPVDGQRSLSAHWKNVMPHEEVGLHFIAE
jgi:hypothetical protein